MKEEHWDVVVTGAGAAGVAAAVAAARGGARTLLVDAGTMPGGELISGIAMLGAQDALGRWVVGGVARELLAQVDALGGYIGPVFDYRALRLVCFDSELMKLALAPWLADCGVSLRLHSFVHGADCAPDGTVRALRLYAKGGEHRVHAKAFVDASGDADVTRLAGGTVLSVGAGESLQPPSLVFRVVGVDTAALLRMVVQEPGHFGLGELPELGLSPQQCALALQRQGVPKVVLLGDRGLLGDAIARGEMFATSIAAVVPVSMARGEVSINCTQLANVDGADAQQLSAALPVLLSQIRQCLDFFRRRVRGFEQAQLSGVAPRVGIRETRRIVADHLLDEQEVLHGVLPPDTVALGAHELDQFAVTSHLRRSIHGGGAYGIPLRALLPVGLRNVVVAGRCLGSTRLAQSSARVMGTCMAMGQAAGTLAALCAPTGMAFRDLPFAQLRERLERDGALLTPQAAGVGAEVRTNAESDADADPDALVADAGAEARS